MQVVCVRIVSPQATKYEALHALSAVLCEFVCTMYQVGPTLCQIAMQPCGHAAMQLNAACVSNLDPWSMRAGQPGPRVPHTRQFDSAKQLYLTLSKKGAPACTA